MKAQIIDYFPSGTQFSQEKVRSGRSVPKFTVDGTGYRVDFSPNARTVGARLAARGTRSGHAGFQVTSLAPTAEAVAASGARQWRDALKTAGANVRYWTTGKVVAAASALLTVVLSGCASGGMTEYRGADAAIDGVLWRLVSSAEDPVRLAATQSPTTTANSFFEELPAVLWDGIAGTVPDLDQAVAVAYDREDTGDGASFSVFVSSGQRPDVLTDRGDSYSGPDSVFTCFGYQVEFGPYAVEDAESTFYAESPSDCPAHLVEAMPGVVAFAEPLVFTG